MKEELRVDKSGVKWLDVTLNETEILAIKLPNRNKLKSCSPAIIEGATRVLAPIIRSVNEEGIGPEERTVIIEMNTSLAYIKLDDELLKLYADEALITVKGKELTLLDFVGKDYEKLFENSQFEYILKAIGGAVLLDFLSRLYSVKI